MSLSDIVDFGSSSVQQIHSAPEKAASVRPSPLGLLTSPTSGFSCYLHQFNMIAVLLPGGSAATEVLIKLSQQDGDSKSH